MIRWWVIIHVMFNFSTDKYVSIEMPSEEVCKQVALLNKSECVYKE